jgi:8-oxo-dGTP pyrophosphatase MutT (NUDIX family)
MLEEGESLADAARRELIEECGIDDVDVGEPIDGSLRRPLALVFLQVVGPGR